MKVKNTLYTKDEVARILGASFIHKFDAYEEKFFEIYDKLYLFDGISKSDVQELTKDITFKRYKKGDVIIQEGDKGEDIFFILYGKVAVVVGNKRVASTINSGSMFGEIAFLTKKPRGATIIAYSQSTAIISFKIDTQRFSQLLSYPFAKLYQNISLDLAKKLELQNSKLLHTK